MSQSAVSLSILGTQNVVYLLHQPCDGNSFFLVFIAYDSWVLNRDYNWDGSFHSPAFPASEVCCHVQSDTNMVENHTITWTGTGIFSRDGHSQAFQCGTVAISINCASMFQDIYQQHMQQIPQHSASRWYDLCHFKLPIPGWDRMFRLHGWSLTAGTELWIHVSSPVTTQCGYNMLKKTETGDHPCNTVLFVDARSIHLVHTL